MSTDVDVAVIGAGLSGLTAAAELHDAGVSLRVLEARDRPGGRLVNHDVGEGQTSELGGQFFGRGDRQLRDLARSLGVMAFETFARGEKLLEDHRGVTTYRGAIPLVGLSTLLDFGIARARLNRLARQVPVDAPWKARRAARWDAETMASWGQRALRTRRGRAMFDTAVRAIWAAEASEQSLLYGLSYIHSYGNLGYLAATRGGAQHFRFEGGPSRLIEALAAKAPAAVTLDVPVHGIEQSRDHVTIHAAGGATTAWYVIVALPPVMAQQVDVRPALPVERRALHERMVPAAAVKVLAVYPEPFWRRDQLSGHAVSQLGPATAWFDNSPPGGYPGVLAGFVVGGNARRFVALPAPERRAQILASLRRLFGPQAASPSAYVEKDWVTDPWSRGCYFAFAPPGVMTSFWPLRQTPVGRLHWAGAETAVEGYGGMNGAVEAGQRTAREVLRRLHSDAAPLSRA